MIIKKRNNKCNFGNTSSGDVMKKIILIIMCFLVVGCNAVKKEKIEVNVKEEEIKLTLEDYKESGVNELGEVPIMMYHGIHDKKNEETEYIGGNVDKNGYQRTVEAFNNDLEFYYKNDYRMIRLNDYVDGNIKVELGKSPIILTFDDGLSNNIKIDGLDENGNLIIDPNCAIGILESFKKKYPDYNVTATFFINAGLFQQTEYNEKIINWLIENGYDIGNHTYGHSDFTKIDANQTQYEVGRMYEILDSIIPEKYINVVALPFGSPYTLEHNNMQYIFDTNYNGKNYITKAALRVGWKAESSPFSIEFNPKFLKRIRAYDNNGVDFDINMNFDLLKNSRYISDGNVDSIVVPQNKSNLVNSLYTEELIIY